MLEEYLTRSVGLEKAVHLCFRVEAGRAGGPGVGREKSSFRFGSVQREDVG